MKVIDSLNPNIILSAINKHKLIKIKNHAIKDKKNLIEFGKSLGELLSWDFGVINELKTHQSPVNYLYSHEAVPFHWDGAFYICPHLLIFHCIKAPAINSGGETLFVDTEKIIKSLSAIEQQAYENISLYYETEKKAHYGGKIKTPLISTHPKTSMPILRYAEPVNSQLNPVFLQIQDMNNSEKENLIKTMKAKLYDKKFCYQHTWKDDELIIADNFSLLHGRNAFSKNSKRHLRRIQIQ